MMGFLDGIKLSLPAAVSHANDIVCRVDGGEKPTISFYSEIVFLPFCDAILWGSAVSPVHAGI